MKPELKSLSSPDVNNLAGYLPNELDNFCILVQALIGPSHGRGEESFDFLVCTPKWLISEVAKEKLLFGRGFIIMNEYNYKYILDEIKGLCDRISGSDWKEISGKLGHFGLWEFEDYSST